MENKENSVETSSDPLNEEQRIQAQAIKDFVPDLRSLGRHQEGFATEIGSSDADKIKQAIEAAKKKPVILEKKLSKRKQPVVHTIAGYRVSHPLPDDTRVGWTAFSDIINPGGSLNIVATEKKKESEIDSLVKYFIWNDNWQDYGVIFIIGIMFWLFGKLNGNIGIFVCGLLFVGKIKAIEMRMHIKKNIYIFLHL